MSLTSGSTLPAPPWGKREAQRQTRRLMRTMKETCSAYDLLAPGDRIMVAISGGKDSYTLLDLLWRIHRLPEREFEVVAVHLDQKQPGYEGKHLVAWLKESGIPFEILSEDTYSVVKEHTPEGGTYCAMCSRLRRGILYTAAERLGCNKIALGHHRDDALQTFLMNLFFAGKLQAMPAKYTTDDGRFEVIRPLIANVESDIIEYAGFRQFPILPCNLCGSQSGLRRQQMKTLLEDLEAQHPHLRSVMFQALGNVCPSHLLDKEVAEQWKERPEGIRPLPTARHKRVVRGRALPVIQGNLASQPLGQAVAGLAPTLQQAYLRCLKYAWGLRKALPAAELRIFMLRPTARARV